MIESGSLVLNVNGVGNIDLVVAVDPLAGKALIYDFRRREFITFRISWYCSCFTYSGVKVIELSQTKTRNASSVS